MPNIYLTGMMGSGKTVTGRKLAILMHYTFVDLDEMIQTRTKKTIAQIFAEDGENYFRREESYLLREVSRLNARVVATGGGSVLRSENVQCMHDTGKIIYLETSFEILWQRVKDKKDRPLLKSDDPKAALSRIYAERQEAYGGSYDFRVATDGLTAEAVAKKIYEGLMQKT